MPTIDWKKIAQKYQEDFLSDLFELLKIDSVRDDEAATSEFPVGPGPAKALHEFLELGERDGFKTENFDNLAGHIEMGSGEELLGILGHVDVVPVGTGWETDPFEPVLKDGRIYARGALDDKGPSMAAYYAMKMINDLGLPVAKRIRMIIGTDEESGWQCMDHYLSVAEMPDFGFSPDAEFPIINGEKGNTTIYLDFEGAQDGAVHLQKFEAGLRANMVPQDAVATLKTDDAAEVQTAFKEYLADKPVNGESEIEADSLILTVVGKAAHGAMPENGINGATYLAEFLNTLDLGGDAKAFIRVTAEYLHNDTTGQKTGVAITDEVMGELSSNPGVFRFDDRKGGRITINMRYPQGTTELEIKETFEETLADEKLKVVLAEGGKEPHYVPVTDPLVQTLLDVYERQTGNESYEQVIGGGTYGRLLERGVAYGAMFPSSVDTMHQANEYMTVDDLMNSMAIYAEAIYELVKPTE